MHISGFRRVLAAVVVAATVGLPAASASASATPAVSGVTCKKLVGSPIALTGTLSGCTSSATGGSGAISNFLPTGGSVVWANSTTTDYTAVPTVGETDTESKSCAATTTEFELAGTVTASTNPAIPVGSAVTMEVCVSHKRITKEPGSKVTF